MPSEERERYTPLLTEDPEYLDTKFNNTVGKSTRRYGHFIYWVVVGVQTLVILVLLSTLWHRKGSLSPSHVVYCTLVSSIYVETKSNNVQLLRRMRSS